MRWVQLVIFIVFLSGLVEGVSATGATATLTSSSTVNLKTGESTTATFNVFNDNSFCTVTAYYSIDSTSYNNLIGRIGPKVSTSINTDVSAPPIGSGSGSVQRGIYVKIVTDSSTWCGGEIYNYQLVLNINYDDSEFQNAKSNAGSAINSAQSAINSAQSSINNAQNAITDAKNLGADASLAENKLFNAQNSMQTAQSKQSSANSYYASSSYNQATNTANEAKSSADTAKSDADSAYSIAVQAKQIAQATKDGASTAITSAKKVIDSASTSKTEAQNAINDAKNIGADIGSAQTLLDAAISKLNSANTKYDEANSYFNTKKWNDAKTTADEAKTYANDALTNAEIAKSTAIQAKDTKIKAAPTPTPQASSEVLLHGEKTDVVIGEDILLKLSVVNLITKPVMTVQLILNPPSGMSVTSSDFVVSGAGQYTSTYKLDPGNARDIEIRLETNQIGDFEVKGRIVYYYGDDKSTAEDRPLNLPIKVRKENTPAQNEINPAQQQTPGFGVIIGISALLFANFFKKKRSKSK